jgi:hypothetical protein
MKQSETTLERLPEMAEAILGTKIVSVEDGDDWVVIQFENGFAVQFQHPLIFVHPDLQ